MASPSYGDRPPLQGYRRSFTVPTRPLSLHERAALDKSDADADILFSHPNARIIAFSPPTDSIPSNSKETLPEADYPVDAIETLPWRSRTETLAATGPIVIEKVRGSSNFLKSTDQKVIHTIMRNSQCWCVDGESKFVLRIARYRYYRIELPAETDVDKQRVEELKAVLAKVLRFERTPCPFKRAFHVDLPDDAITPSRKVPWKRKPTPQLSPPNSDPLPLRRTKNTRAWSLQGQTAASPLQTYGRRGSDYGFSASRDSSPRPQYDGDAFRSRTPSSLSSSEEASGSRLDEGSSEEGLNIEESTSKYDDDEVSIDSSLPQESPQVPEAVSFAADQPSEPDVKESCGTTETEHDSWTPSDVEALPAPETDMEVPERTLASVEVTGEAHEQEVLHENIGELETRGETDAKEAQVAEASASEGFQKNTEVLHDHQPEGKIQEHDDIVHSEVGEALGSAGALVDSLEQVSQPTEHQDDEPNEQTPEDQLLADDIPSNVEAVGTTDTEEPAETEHTFQMEEEIPAEEMVVSSEEDDVLSRVSSAESFHSTNSLTRESLAQHTHAADLETTPQAEKFDPLSGEPRQHHRELSELTVTASTVDGYSERSSDLRPSTNDSMNMPSTPGLLHSSVSDSSWPEVHTPASVNEGLRRRLNAKRSFSPLPPSSILFSPSSPSHRSIFNAEFFQKAAHVALVKPIEAVALLVHVLARIAGGATVNDLLSGELFRRPEHHRRSSSSFPDQASAPRDDSDDEDDFGVPFRGRSRSAEIRRQATPAKDADGSDSIFDLD